MFARLCYITLKSTSDTTFYASHLCHITHEAINICLLIISVMNYLSVHPSLNAFVFTDDEISLNLSTVDTVLHLPHGECSLKH